jgi:hypothetical protein
MLKLVKWTLIGVVTASAAGWFVFGDGLFSYFTTIAGSVRDSVRGQVPVEFELKRAERLIRDIEPQILGCKRDVAQAEVNLDNLRNDVERLEKSVGTSEQKLKHGAAWLTAETKPDIRLAGRPMSRQRVELDLERTLQNHRNNTELLRGKRALIQHQEIALAAAREKLDAVRSEKARLEDLIATMKTQKAQIDALAAGSIRFDLDDSALSKAKELLAEVKNRLDVAQKMIADDMYFGAGIETTPAAVVDVVGQIERYFAENDTVAAESTERIAPEAASTTRATATVSAPRGR